MDVFFLIRITCPCDLYPLTPHFYIVKMGFTGVNIFFLFLLQDIDCGYSIEPHHYSLLHIINISLLPYVVMKNSLKQNNSSPNRTPCKLKRLVISTTEIGILGATVAFVETLVLAS